MAARTEAWEEARRLVVAEGLSYAEAAQACGLSVSTVEKRGSAEGWQAQRQHAMSYDAQMRAIKARYASRLVELSEDVKQAGTASQLIIALTNLERAYPEHRYQKKGDPKARLAAGSEFFRFLVEFLSTRDRNLIALLEPHADALAAAWEDHVAAA